MGAAAPDVEEPTIIDVLQARRRIAPHLPRTPLYRYGALDASTGAQVWVKHENHQPVGAFKVRGGVNLVAALDPAARAAGLIAASTGNHGQSIAYAAQLHGANALICVPRAANPGKVESIRALGAQVVSHGQDFDEVREHCEELAAEHGSRYVHSGDEPLLIAGVATRTLRRPPGRRRMQRRQHQPRSARHTPRRRPIDSLPLRPLSWRGWRAAGAGHPAW